MAHSHAAEPNLFELSGNEIQITYSASSISGEPLLTYKDGQQTLSFKGEELRKHKSEIGTQITVSLKKTVDQGYTSLTLIVPNVNLAGEREQTFNAVAIITDHLYGIQPLQKGAREVYTVLSLQGTAQMVEF